jgi:hypothetical protein
VPGGEPRSTARNGWRTFVRLLGFLRPYRASLIVSTVLAIAAQVAAILVLVVTGAVIYACCSPKRASSSSSGSYGAR